MIRVILTLILLFQLISCGTEPDNNSFPNLVFRENELLITPLKTFNNLSISLPKNIDELDSARFSMLESTFENIKDNYFIIDVLAAYTNDDGFACIISSVENEEIIYDVIKNQVEPNFINRYGKDKLVTGQFSIKGNKVFQMMSKNNNITNYKFYIDVVNKNSFQIDYFIPPKNFIKLQEAMEASISTVNVKNKENKNEN